MENGPSLTSWIYVNLRDTTAIIFVGFCLVTTIYTITTLGLFGFIPELFPTEVRLRGTSVAGTCGHMNKHDLDNYSNQLNPNHDALLAIAGRRGASRRLGRSGTRQSRQLDVDFRFGQFVFAYLLSQRIPLVSIRVLHRRWPHNAAKQLRT